MQLGMLGVVALAGVSLAHAGEIPADLQAEADKIKAQYFTQCGDDYYAQLPSRMVEPSGPSPHPSQRKPPKMSMTFAQYKGLTMHVSVEDLSRADELNGVAWRGHIQFAAHVQREFHEFANGILLQQYPQGWSEWKASVILAGVHLEHKQGQIVVTMGPHPAWTPRAPECAAVPQ